MSRRPVQINSCAENGENGSCAGGSGDSGSGGSARECKGSDKGSNNKYDTNVNKASGSDEDGQGTGSGSDGTATAELTARHAKGKSQAIVPEVILLNVEARAKGKFNLRSTPTARQQVQVRGFSLISQTY